MIKIAPSLLAADFASLREEITRITSADMLHLDVMDGHFVPNLTFGPGLIKAIRPHSELVFDTHLMISNPGELLEDFAAAGSDIITIHEESTFHSHRLIQRIKDLGCQSGLSLNPGTGLDGIEYLLPDLDLILLMTVNPGFGGQEFIPVMLDKIARLRKIIEASPHQVEIAVDGGIKPENLGEIIKSGATVIVSGSSIFGASSPEEVIRRYRDIAADSRRN